MAAKALVYLFDCFKDRLAISIVVLGLLYPVAVVSYRLFFSELAGFPGPKIAAATTWYEFYHDFFREGKYIFEIEKMHRQYGPIVRITPDELSINDLDAYNEIYVSDSKRKTDGHPSIGKGLDLDVDHDLHRRRRKPLEPFFSRLGVSRLQHMLAEVVEKLAGRINALIGTHTVTRLDHVFSAFAGDIIGRICWENEKEFLDDPNFGSDWYNILHMVIRSIPLFAGLPFLVSLANMVPTSIFLWAVPSTREMSEWKQIGKYHIAKAKLAKEAHDLKGTHMDDKASLFRHILNSDMPESERSDERLSKEAQVLLAAGTATTARTLTTISYYILARPQIRARLEHELQDTMARYPERVPSWADLERLPYLQALIKEGLRFVDPLKDPPH
ncbi:MAG: hypothetical protein Q9218_006071 [Villophora microphyllina]